MKKTSSIFLAGHLGLVGSSILRKLRKEGFSNLLLAGREELDLTLQSEVDRFFEEHKPEYVFMAAARVGGIHANSTYPAEFIYNNLTIQSNIIQAAWRNNVSKLLFLGSSCIYPKFAEQPMKETELLTGDLEPTNQWYAIAKIAGIKMCQAYRRQYGFNAISLMPTNLYGPGDNFDLENSHVLPALIRKFHEGKQSGRKSVEVWGSGSPRREFLYIDDLADAVVFLMSNYDEEEIINVGSGKDIAIAELAELVSSIIGYEGDITFNSSKPDGMARKLLDVSKINKLGWYPKMDLRDGIEATYQWYLNNLA